jgi:CDP-diacylglycerol---serine O-phosphatidyltransferase
MFLRLVKRSEVPLVAIVPNLLTTLALSSALASIHFSIRAAVLQAKGADIQLIENFWQRALVAVLLSAVFDALDGRAARLLRVSSKFGAVLDSLSDFVAFGVAPALILHQWVLADWINATGPGARLKLLGGLLPVMVFAVCSGMRLARFTAAASNPKPHAPSNYFVGMPTPAAAGAVLVPAMLRVTDLLGSVRVPEWLVAIYTLLIAFLMISRIPMFALKRIRINRLMVAPLLVLVCILVVMMVIDPWLTLSGLALAYLLSLPFAVYRRRRAPDEQHQPSSDSTPDAT